MSSPWVKPFPYFINAYKLSYFSKSFVLLALSTLSVFTVLYYYVLTLLFFVEPPSLDYLLGWPFLLVLAGSVFGFLFVFILGFEPLLALPTTGRSYNVLGIMLLSFACDAVAVYFYCKFEQIQFFIGILVSLGIRQIGLWLSYFLMKRMARHEESVMDSGDMLAYIGVESFSDLWPYFGCYSVYDVICHGFLFLKYITIGGDSELYTILMMSVLGLIGPFVAHCVIPMKKKKGASADKK